MTLVVTAGFRLLFMVAVAVSLPMQPMSSGPPGTLPPRVHPLTITAATDKDDTNADNTTVRLPITCHCNTAGCQTNENGKHVCTSMLGCFSKLQSAVPINEKETPNLKDLDEFSVFVGGHVLNGTYGCLEFLPTKLSCDEILKSMEGDESEFPEIQSPSHETMVKQIKAYHCCSVDLCNDRTRVSKAEKISQASLVAALVKSSEVEDDATSFQKNSSATTIAPNVADAEGAVLKIKSATVLGKEHFPTAPVVPAVSVKEIVSDPSYATATGAVEKFAFEKDKNPPDGMTAKGSAANKSGTRTKNYSARKNNEKSSMAVSTAKEVTVMDPTAAASSDESVGNPRSSYTALTPTMHLDRLLKNRKEDELSKREKLFHRVEKRHDNTQVSESTEQHEAPVTEPHDTPPWPDVPNENRVPKSIKTKFQPITSTSEPIYHNIDNESGSMESNWTSDVTAQMLAIVGIVSVTLVTLIVLGAIKYIRNITDIKNIKVVCSNPGERCACSGRKRPLRPFTGPAPKRSGDDIFNDSLCHTPFVANTVAVEPTNIPLVNVRR